MIELPLSQGLVALIDNCDAEQAEYGWHALKGGRTFYAVRMSKCDENGKRKRIYLHREIVKPGSDCDVDHINGNGLDNRRENLRMASTGENTHNQQLRKDNTSGYKGVYWYKAGNKWQASIRFNKKGIHLGYFADKTEAAQAYDVAAIRLFGEFARLNFPHTLE